LADLRSTDPRDDKTRIERTKGGLLKDAYRWILDHEDFQQWRIDKESRLLWIKGGPGKGKTMLLIGIIKEIERQSEQSTQDACLLSYYFCQGTDSRLNTATAVLRGLIYLLLIQKRSLMSHIREKYEHAGKNLFEDINAFDALSNIFINLLHDSTLKEGYLIIDALDECETDLPELLDLITRSASTCSHVKWIVSSRNKPNIEAQLRIQNSQRPLSLELNKEHVSRAVEIFIDYKVSQLVSIKYDSTLQEKIRNQMRKKANGTFLWVALVFEELKLVKRWRVEKVLMEMPTTLELLYKRMMEQIEQLKDDDLEFCRYVLSTMTLAYRPLHLLELGAMSGLPEEISRNIEDLVDIINMCGSFLTLQEDSVYFIHQSAKDYLDSDTSKAVFPSGRGSLQYDMFSRSLHVMSRKLQRDMYRLREPGFSIDSAIPPSQDPLSSLRYSCIYWAKHLDEAYKCNVTCQSSLSDGGNIHIFLQTYFLYWLEALSLIKNMSSSIQTINTLLTLLKVRYNVS
jgi:hypothetical protein